MRNPPSTPDSFPAQLPNEKNLDAERLALALDAAAAATWDNDIARGCVHLDARWGAIIGHKRPAHTVATRRLLSLVHPDDRSRAISHVRACYRGRLLQFRVEYRVRHANGEWIWVLCRGRVVEFAANGRARRMIGINTDITEQKQAEARVIRHSQFLTQIQAATVDLLNRPDASALLAGIATRAETLFGAQGATVALFDGTELIYRACTPGAAYLQGKRFDRSQALLSWRAVDAREPFAVEDYSAHYDLAPPTPHPGRQACAVFPILSGDTVFGVIGISRTGAGQAFTADELQMGRLFAQIAALVLRNTGVHDETVRLAADRTAALRESEERYRTLIEMSGDAIFLIDQTGRIRAANATAARLHGFTVEELTAMTIGELDAPASAKHVPERLARLFAGETMSFEVTHRRKDGTKFPLDVIASAVRINGETLIMAFDRDVTARRAVEDALRESEEKFRGVFDHSPEIICLTTLPEGRIVELNPAAVAAFGHSRDEAIGQTTLDLGVWADLGERRRYLAAVEAQGAVKGFEARLRRRDGTFFTALFSSSRLQLGGRSYTLNLLQDITARKESEDARERLLAQVQATLESTTDGILVVDPHGRIQSYNRLFVEMWRLPEEVLATRDDALALQHAVKELVDPAAFVSQVQELYATPFAESFDTLHFRDGRTFERFSRPQLIKGVPAGRVWSFRDVTARVHAEQQRAALESSLREAKKMESLGTLAGGVAHDFNNLLSGMCGYVEIALERLPADHPARQWLGQTMDLGQRARELVRQILTFSRRTIVEYKPLDLAVVVTEALKLSRFSLPAGAELQTQIDPDCPPIAADTTQIHQVVMNLCTNAAQALPTLGGRIIVAVAPAPLPARIATARPELASKQFVRLSVADNGCGMSAATLERIFEPFFTTKEEGRGTGLGLSVVHGIVGAHGGAIDVRSQPGAGTTFEIFFPALPVASPAYPLSNDIEPTTGRQEPILWVDDNPATGEVIKHLLTLMGYRVTHAPSADRALAIFRANPAAFALMISDLAMPGMDGADLARAVLQLRPDLPVIIVTGMLSADQQARLLAAGTREIVFKPVTRAELAQAVSRHLPPS